MHQLYEKYTRIYLNRLTIILIIFSAWFIISCGDSDTEPASANNYLPLAVGTYQIYAVKEEIYSSGQATPAIKTWQEKDEITRINTNTNGVSTFVVSNYSRNAAGDSWQKIKEYSIERFPDKLIFNNDNQITVPLVFPISQSLKWNGNMYNNLDKEDYRYENIDTPYQLGNLSFDKSLTVVERSDTTSVITYSLGIKRYGLNAGLIYDEQTFYDFCQATPDCIGQGIVDSGSRKVRTILEFGNGQ